MLRQFFIQLSRRPRLGNFLIKLPGGTMVASRFVAGTRTEDIITACEESQQQGFQVAADHLGEDVTSKKLVTKAVKDYKTLLHDLSLTKIRDPSISLKLTQLGLRIDKKLAEKNVMELLTYAKARGIRVEIDMEDYTTVEDTLAIYKKALKRYPGTVVAIQSYLHRTPQDLKELIKLKGASVRLVKGAYLEKEEVAFKDKRDVDLGFEYCLNLMFSPEAKRNKFKPLVGSHDERMIATAKREARRHKWEQDQYEFEMLFGIRTKLARELVFQGYKVRLYIPYGQAWYPYFMRRLAERPANVLFLAKNFFRA